MEKIEGGFVLDLEEERPIFEEGKVYIYLYQKYLKDIESSKESAQAKTMLRSFEVMEKLSGYAVSGFSPTMSLIHLEGAPMPVRVFRDWCVEVEEIEKFEKGNKYVFCKSDYIRLCKDCVGTQIFNQNLKKVFEGHIDTPCVSCLMPLIKDEQIESDDEALIEYKCNELGTLVIHAPPQLCYKIVE